MFIIISMIHKILHWEAGIDKPHSEHHGEGEDIQHHEHDHHGDGEDGEDGEDCEDEDDVQYHEHNQQNLRL